MTGVNTSAKADASKTREDRIKDSGHKTEDLVSYHPAVRTHPETGRKSLYVNTAHTERFDGWTKEESAPLLQFLFEHQVKPEFTCRFRWEPGSIAFWDNRAGMISMLMLYCNTVSLLIREQPFIIPSTTIMATNAVCIASHWLATSHGSVFDLLASRVDHESPQYGARHLQLSVHRSAVRMLTKGRILQGLCGGPVKCKTSV